MSDQLVAAGVDPGLAKCGYCLLRGETLLAVGVIRTKKSDGPEEARIRAIIDALREVIDLCPEEVTLLAVETQHAQSGATLSEIRGKASRAMSVAAVRGAVIEVAYSLGIRVCEVSPQEGKRALTGSGKADKQQMMAMALARFGEKLASDAADACGIALAGMQVVEGRTPPRKAKMTDSSNILSSDFTGGMKRAPRPEATAGLPDHVKAAMQRGQK